MLKDELSEQQKQYPGSVVFADFHCMNSPTTVAVMCQYVISGHGTGKRCAQLALASWWDLLQHSTGCGIRTLEAKVLRGSLPEDVAFE